MRVIKRIILCLIFVLVTILTFSQFNKKANAESYYEMEVSGASVRTINDGHRGIRFEAIFKHNLPFAISNAKFGIVVCYGIPTNLDDFIVGGTVNGKTVINVEFDEELISGNDNKFYLTIFNVPEEYYTQNITARAYLFMDSQYKYSSDLCTRNLAEVTFKALNDGVTGEFLTEVKNSVAESDYKKAYVDGNGNVHIEDIVDETNPTYLQEYFIEDWNAMFPSNKINSTSLSDYLSAMQQSTIVGSRMYQFFHNNTKWSWLPNLFYSSGDYNNNAANLQSAILGDDECVEDPDWNSGTELITAINKYFNLECTSVIYKLAITRIPHIAYSKIGYSNNVTCLKTGETYSLPSKKTINSVKYDILYSYSTNTYNNSTIYESDEFICSNNSAFLEAEYVRSKTSSQSFSSAVLLSTSQTIDGTNVADGTEYVITGSGITLKFKNFVDKGFKLYNEEGIGLTIYFEDCSFKEYSTGSTVYLQNVDKGNTTHKVFFTNCTFTNSKLTVDSILHLENISSASFNKCTFNNINTNAIGFYTKNANVGAVKSINIVSCNFLNIGGCPIYVECIDYKDNVSIYLDTIKFYDCINNSNLIIRKVLNPSSSASFLLNFGYTGIDLYNYRREYLVPKKCEPTAFN